MTESRQDIPKQVGPFSILGILGQGGMATIYRARSDQYGEVALKVIKPEFLNQTDFTRRFSREARIYQQMDHPGIVRVFATNQEPSQGALYLAMEVLDGHPLDAVLAEYRQPDVAWAVDVAIRILEALTYAHNLGIVHRDLKPANIIIRPDGRPALVDFGIAYLTNATSITQTGKFLGTPAYISPEMIHQIGDALPQTDLYSVGVILYEMVTGRLPFQCENAMSMLFSHMHEPVPPPRLYNRHVSYALQALILKAMSKDATARHESAAEMAGELRDLDHVSLLSPNITRSEGVLLGEPIRSGMSTGDQVEESQEPPSAPSLVTLDPNASILGDLSAAELAEALDYYFRGDPSRALDLLTNLATSKVESEQGVKAQLLIGYISWRDRNFEAAIESLKKIFSIWPQTPQVWPARYLMARSHYELKDYLAAVREFKLVVTSSRDMNLSSSASAGLGASMQQCLQEAESLLTDGDVIQVRDFLAPIKKLWEEDRAVPMYQNMYLSVIEGLLEKCRVTLQFGDHLETKILGSPARKSSRSSRSFWILGVPMALLLIPLLHVGLVDRSLYLLAKIRFFEIKNDIPGLAESLQAYLQTNSGSVPRWLQLARLQQRSGDLAGSQWSYRKLMKALAPAPPEDLVREAVTAFARNAPSERIQRDLKDMSILLPDSTAIVEALAEQEAKNGQVAAALERLETFLMGRSMDPGIIRLKALLQTQGPERQEGAMQIVQEALNLNPGATDLELRLAELHLETGLVEEAAREVEALVQLDPPPAGAYELQASILGRRGRPKEAIQALLKACEAAPCPIPRWLEIAAMWSRLGDAAEAASIYAKVLAENPNESTALKSLAEVKEEKGLFVEAEQLYRRLVLQAGSRVPSNLASLARMLIQGGQIEEAQAVVAEIKKLGSGEDDACLELQADLASLTGQTLKALELFDQLLSHEPPDPRIAVKAGKLLMDQGSFDRASLFFVRCVQEDPTHAQAWNWLGICRLQKGQTTAAVTALQRAVENAPRDPNVQLNLGLALKTLGQKAQARLHLQESLRLAPLQEQAAKIRTLLTILGQ